MPKITSVEPQKKNSNRFNIYLDGEFAFGVDEDLVVERRLVPGKLLTTSDTERLLFETEIGKLMERMYRLFNIRQRSEKEVRNYLRNLSFKRKVKDQEEISELVIDSVIEKLKRKGMINDQEFARSWVEARRRSKMKGNRALMSELLQKGVDRHIIVEVLGGENNQSELAERALQKKLKLWKSLPYLEFKKKTYEYLLRRGFEYSVVKSVIEKLLKKE